MSEFINFINSIIPYTGIFLLMFSTFLIGYFSSRWSQQNTYLPIIKKLKQQIKALKETHNNLLQQKKVEAIDTIFTEIKPKIISVVKETQEEINKKREPKRVSLKARTSYLNYTKKVPEIDFKKLGYGDKNNPDDLTLIEGIGPYVEEKLNEIGIYNFKQISNFTIIDIRTVTELIEFFPGRIENDKWIEQAKKLTSNKLTY